MRFKRSGRDKVIAVFAATRIEAERAVAHAQTSPETLPIRVCCAEEFSPAPPGCSSLVSDAQAFRRDLRGLWPALTIVAWTGKKGSAELKLRPFLIPPFRVLVLNEAGDFFPGTPGEIARHLRRRIRDARLAWVDRTRLRTKSLAWRGRERTRDILRLLWAYSWRAGERIRDLAVLVWVRLKQAAERVRNVAVLVWVRLGQAAERVRNVAVLIWVRIGQTAERVRNVAVLFWSYLLRTGERIADMVNWAGEGLLALLAGATRWTSPSLRAWGRRSIEAREPDAGSGETFIEVRIPNRGWPRRKVQRTLTESRAEWIVLRWRDELAGHAEIRSLIAMANETGAFAAAKQIAHSAWRERVAPKHPFRRLQPGEVAEVFAPYSTLLVLRRGTAARLGIPRALTFGGALLILFWKASAAGLRSIVVGQGGAVTDEPAMELEDTELALRLMVSPSLSGMGSLRPGRFRGNVAWAPFQRRRFRGKPRVLVVSPYLPFPLTHGGAVRIWNLCRALADRVDFVLACFREANETVDYERLHEVFRAVYILDQDEKPVDSGMPKHVAEYGNSAMTDLIRSLCSELAVDLVQLEYTQLAGYREHTGDVPVILVEHDITFTLYRQLSDLNGGAEILREYQRWLAFETEALRSADMVWTVSGDDREAAIEHGAAGYRTKVIPNGVDLRRFSASPEPAGPPVILFVGSLRHLPNILAFEALRESVMPVVWRDVPDAILHVIAGPAHERAAEAAGKANLLAADPRIVIDGYVEDVRPAYRRAAVVAIPLPISAGTNIKVMEAMACGRAIVSTRPGCRGLELASGRDLIVADLDEFAAALVDLLRNDDLRGRIAAEARRTAERRFGWETIAEDAFNCYAGLLETPELEAPEVQLRSPVDVDNVERGLPFLVQGNRFDDAEDIARIARP